MTDKTTTPAPNLPDAEELAERHRRYSRFVPVHPLRTCRVPAVLAEEPEFLPLAAERRALQQAETKLLREAAELGARNAAAEANHREQQRRAALTGGEPPPPLELEVWRYPQHPRVLFDEYHQVVEAAELALLEEHAERWRDLLRTKLQPIRNRIATAERELEAARAEEQPLAAALERLPGLQATEEPPRVSRSPREGATAREAAEDLQRLFDESRRPERRRR